ncbi:MAG: hypothetical protein CMO55_18255 [Verrucomicrobiales bacterium]|nr:hypothetical protein [Verrucomicrobiales bacterium]
MGQKAKEIRWGELDFAEADQNRVRCGDVLVEMRRSGKEISLASRQLKDGETGEEDDDSAKWTRWAVSNNSDKIQILPSLPDLPVLVNPTTPFNILPGADVRLFVRLPISVTVGVRGDLEQTLLEVPTEKLSNTWFGETDNGELCYWLEADIHTEPLPEIDAAGAMAVLAVHNDSSETLPVERICLRVGGLTLYQADDRLVTNATVIRYQGGVQPSNVTLKNNPPREYKAAKLVNLPREAGPQNVVGRTFRSLRKWTVDLLDIG